jgi:hypothetical protein
MATTDTTSRAETARFATILPIGTTVAIWESYGAARQPRRYINVPSAETDATRFRETAYGLRQSGQGEDNVYHRFIGVGTVVATVPFAELSYCQDYDIGEPGACRDWRTCTGHRDQWGVTVEMAVS